MIGHAQAITENRAACDSAGGIDGGYGDLETLPAQVSNCLLYTSDAADE